MKRKKPTAAEKRLENELFRVRALFNTEEYERKRLEESLDRAEATHTVSLSEYRERLADAERNWMQARRDATAAERILVLLLKEKYHVGLDIDVNIRVPTAGCGVGPGL